MFELGLNIIGGEWMIIIFVALILLFGTNKLPEAGRKIGKIVGEYNKAKTEMQNQVKEYSDPNSKTNSNNISVDGPVQTERQKLEYMAKSLGINIEDKTDVELRQIISSKFGSAQKNSDEELKENKFKN
jgi:sec-independent protein translocase protein TatA|tara:strand:+ start:3114 stop:3500 length:387 start_codon:yes stop_codon:yes gene_type:complete